MNRDPSSLLKIIKIQFAWVIRSIVGTPTGFVVLMLWINIANHSLLVGAETDTVVTELETYGAGV
jgi:hypothetical protein